MRIARLLLWALWAPLALAQSENATLILLQAEANCKSIRDDDGYWHRIEHYLAHHSKASLSHGICPDCADDLYPDLVPSLKKPDGPDSKTM